MPDLVRAAVAGVLLFGVCGFGLVRLALPAGLRPYELLWVLPVGACACALALTVLGYLYVPFDVSLWLVVGSAVALAVVAWRREGAPAVSWSRVAWPLWVAALVAAVALIPLFRAGFVTVGGQGQDAHMAVGTAQFLQEHHPTGKAIEEPVDEVWLVWRSKPPIYYALAAHSQVAGMEPYKVISTQQALLLAISLCGFFLLALQVLRAPPWAAVLGAATVGLDRMVMHTVMHPYFNQTWGLMVMPFVFVLAWWAVAARSRGGLALLGLLAAIGTFAYPLMIPLPLLALAVWLWPERHRFGLRARARALWHGRRTLLWLVPLGFVLILPLAGVAEKFGSAANVVLNPSRTLRSWGGDLTTYYEEAWFFAASEGVQLLVVAPLLVVGVTLCFRARPALLARGFLVLFAFAAVFALWFRVREFGFYFHFKILAFVAPLVLLCGIAGLARWRPGGRAWVGAVAAALLFAGAYESASDEVDRTFDQLPKKVLELRTLTADVPAGSSIRLDVAPSEQNWVAFMLHERPLCSRRPLLGTSYPRVRASRRADFILTKRRVAPPADADGLVRRLEDFALWRAAPGLPGPENCSREMVQGVTQVDQ